MIGYAPLDWVAVGGEGNAVRLKADFLRMCRSPKKAPGHVSRAPMVSRSFQFHLIRLIFLSQQESQSLFLVAPGESILPSCETGLECRTQSVVPYHPSDPETRAPTVSQCHPRMDVCSIT